MSSISRTHLDPDAPLLRHDVAWGLLLLCSAITVGWLRLNLMRPLDGHLLTHDERDTIKAVGGFSGIVTLICFLVALQHWLRREKATQPSPTLLSGVITPILTCAIGAYALYSGFAQLARLNPYGPNLTPGESWSMWGMFGLGLTLPLLSGVTVLWYVRLRRGLPVVMWG